LGRAPTILLVEDDDSLRAVLLRLLGQDYNVLAARDGQGAMTILYRYPGAIDLLLADAGLPDMDGWDLVRRAVDLRPAAYRVIMSGELDADFAAAQLSPPCRFLAKPFQVSDLHALVAEALSLPQDEDSSADGALPDSSQNERVAAHTLG